MIFYHLPDSVPIKYVFEGFKGTWFLHVEAKPLIHLDGSSLYQSIDTNIRDLNHNSRTETNDIISNGDTRLKGTCGTEHMSKNLSRTESLLNKRKRKKEKKLKCATACNSSPLVQIFGERLLKAMVWADLVKRCSSNDRQVSRLCCPPSVDVSSIASQSHFQKITKRDDKNVNIQIDDLPQFTVKTPPRTSNFPTPSNPRAGASKNKPDGPEVGKRLVNASKNISISACKTSSTISICRLRNKKLLPRTAVSLAKFLAFEISDNDDERTP